MLRQIVSVSLVMTACTAFVSTKANAAFLTFTESGVLRRQPDSLITFNVELNPESTLINFVKFSYQYDGNELSLVTESIWSGNEVPGTEIRNTEIRNTREIANITFRVLKEAKEEEGNGLGDFFSLVATYKDPAEEPSLFAGVHDNQDKVDVVAIPEPITMFGTATALGWGVLLKRKFSKRNKS